MFSLRKFFICSVLSALMVLGISCTDSPAGVHQTNSVRAPTAPSRMIATDDPCWTDAYSDCDDAGHLGSYVSGSAYDYLGGANPCFTGTLGSCGSGFGEWNDAC